MADRHLQARPSEAHLFGKGYLFSDKELKIDHEGRIHDFDEHHEKFLLATGKWKVVEPASDKGGPRLGDDWRGDKRKGK